MTMPTLRKMGPLEAVSEAVNKFLPGHRPSRMGKLLKNVEKLPQLEWAQNLVDYLLKKDDFSIVEKSLEGLEASNMPALSPYRMEERSTSVRITVALEALRDLQPLLVAIDSAPSSPALDAYSKKCWGMVTESWKGVLKWLSFLLADASGFTNSRLVVSSCSYLLLVVAGINEKAQEFKEQMMSDPGTLQVIRSLMCQIDPHTKSHYNLAYTPETGAVDIQMLEFCTARHVSLTNFHALLRAHPTRHKKPMMGMFFKRAEEMRIKIGSMSSAGLCGSIQDLARLCAVLSRLFGDYEVCPALPRPERREILVVYPSLLSKWCEKAHEKKIKDPEVWANVAECIGYLVLLATRMKFRCTFAVRSLVEGGILPCISRCTPYALIPLAKTALRAILAYLYPPKVFNIALARKDDKLWEVAKSVSGGEEDSVYHEFHAFFQLRKSCLPSAGSPARPLNMCTNREHAITAPGGNGGISPTLKSCASCHAVVYCSEKCQREDWLCVHSATCAALSASLNEARSDHAWPSLDARSDQMRIIESYANANFLPPEQHTPHSAHQSSLPKFAEPPRKSQPQSEQLGPFKFNPRNPRKWVVLDFHTGDEARLLCHEPETDGGNMRSALRDRLLVLLEKHTAENAGPVVFVEGRFRLNDRHGSLVLAELHFSADSQKYQAVHSYHSIGTIANPWIASMVPYTYDG